MWQSRGQAVFMQNEMRDRYSFKMSIDFADNKKGTIKHQKGLQGVII